MEGPESFPISPCAADIGLLDILDSRRYDELNQVIKEGAIETYKAEITPLCDALLENERLIDRAIPLDELKEPSESETDGESWYKDPTQLSSFELFQAISNLQMKIDKQKKINDRSQGDIEILSLAKNSLDLEIGYKLFELITLEKQLQDL